ncbi:MAG TPA: MFS transporter [Ignavibacteriaceae bacterium]|nr:MFS transporter [Ignavibacteriaceae bacterium]
MKEKGRVFVWTLFDFANTAFYVVILTVGYPLYFKEIITEGAANSDFLWGLTFSISMLIVALISPLLGAIADYGFGKKKFLAFFTALCIVATGLLFFTGSAMIFWGIFLLVLANIGFEAGLVFYDAFLPELTAEKNYGRVSGYGFAMGYVGSLITLLIVFPLYQAGFEEANLLNIKISFILAAVLFLLFALPLFIYLPDKQHKMKFETKFISEGYLRLRSTFSDFKKYKNIAVFLIAYFLYIDGVNTVIIFSSIFARETLDMDFPEIILLFVIVQSCAIIGSAIFGIISDHIGHKKTLIITLLIWIGIVTSAFFVEDKNLFYIIAAFAGISLGSSQSTSRSLMSLLTPIEKKTEFFGFYSFFGKASAILGPFVFGIISSAINQRTAILAIAFFFIVGLLILTKVKDPQIIVNK